MCVGSTDWRPPWSSTNGPMTWTISSLRIMSAESAHLSNSIYIRRLRFTDGTEVPIEPAAVVVVVGPNNAGKSQTLASISIALGLESGGRGYSPCRVEMVGEPSLKEALLNWATNRAPRISAHGREQILIGNTRAPSDQLEEWFEKHCGRRGQEMPIFGRGLAIKYDVGTRLGIMNPCGPTDNPRSADAPVTARLHHDPTAPRRLSEITSDAFGKGIVFDTHSGGKWTLRLGQLDPPESDEFGRQSNEYRRQVEQLPAVYEQGDGLRSFVGLAAAVLTGELYFAVVDEPEAFLHPPQAQRLGRTLVAEKPHHAQLFVSTHDPNLLRGIMDAAKEKSVSVIRVSRAGELRTRATLLDAEVTKQLWDTPLLR